jgi:anti-anti-sigma regulatory factor/Na+-transporting methylmalonyl-CoA/oxaloacetate decarboxylase gamma subunit
LVRDPLVEFTAPSTLINSWLVFMLLGMAIVIIMMSLISQLTGSLHTAEQAAQESNNARQQAEHLTQQMTQQVTTLEEQYHTERHLRELIDTLEVPTIILQEGVLLTTLVGTIDTRRAQHVMERLLLAARDQQAHLVLIDIAGVAAVDTQVAAALMQTARALKLLGCRVAITGIRAEVASTLTTRGIDLKGVMTARSPQQMLQDRKKGMV